MRACLRRAIKGLHPHPTDKNLIPAALIATRSCVRWPHRGQSERGRPRDPGRPVPFVGNGKAIALGEDQGLVKVIFQEDRPAPGAHMIGRGTELIQGYVVAMNLETTEEELMHTIFPTRHVEMMKGSGARRLWRVLNI